MAVHEGFVVCIVLKEECAIGPVVIGIAKERQKTSSIDESIRCYVFCPTGIQKGRQYVDVCGNVRKLCPCLDLVGPTDEEGHPNTALVDARFGTAKSGIVAVGIEVVLLSGSPGPVIGKKNHDGVFFQVELLQSVHDKPHIFIDIGYHPVGFGIDLIHSILAVGVPHTSPLPEGVNAGDW